MANKKKKTFTIVFEVNMDASSHETVTVVATKYEIAVKKAEKVLLSRGFFTAFPVSYKIME